MRNRPRLLLTIGAIWIALVAGVRGQALAFLYTRYENLGNPTEYLFHQPVGQVKRALKTYQDLDTDPIRAAFYSGDRYGFVIPVEYYTKRYWTGPREKNGDVDPPEAGKIGTLLASFDVHIVPEGDNCRLKVEADQFELQTGRHYAVFPHFHLTGTRKKVRSDTYFEYLFLAKVGELLGEKGMPALKGDATEDDWPGKLP